MRSEYHGHTGTQNPRRAPDSSATDRTEFVIAAVTLLLGALAIVAGTFDPLWNWLGIGSHENELRGLLSVGVSVFIMLVGILGTVWLLSARTLNKVSSDVSGIVGRVQAHVPSFASAEIVSKEAAFEELELQLQMAATAWNTRLGTGHEPTRYSTPGAQRYVKRIGTELERGLEFVDVAAATFEDDARKLLAISKKSEKGRYQCLLYEQTGPGYINFIVIRLKDGSHLTFCGWSTTLAPGGDRSVLRFRDETVACFFREWHSGLASAADKKVK